MLTSVHVSLLTLLQRQLNEGMHHQDEKNDSNGLHITISITTVEDSEGIRYLQEDRQFT